MNKRFLLLAVISMSCGDDSDPVDTCGDGTTLVGNACVPDAVCGDGTTLVDGECQPDVACGPGTVVVDGACVPAAPALTCGENTTMVAGVCVGDAECGEGTTLVDGICETNAVCGDDTTLIAGVCEADAVCGEGTTLTAGECIPDVVCGSGTVADNGQCVPAPPVFAQIEHLARPGINEALLITDAFNAGYNATAPTFAGVPSDVLTQVVTEAKTVLKAIYLGTCLINGALGLTPQTGLKPGLVTCAEVGPSIFEGGQLTGTVITAASAAQAQVYADKVFGQFVPDVMRINTTAASSYLTVCGDGDSTPLLCGGRRLDDDTIDVTYNYLIGGLAGTPGPQVSGNALADQVRALTSDGVAYQSDAAAGVGNNKLGLTDGVPANTQQGHPAITNTFPYSAPAF